MKTTKDEIILAEAESILEKHGTNWSALGLKLRGFNNSVIRTHRGEFNYGAEYGKRKLSHEEIVCATPKMKKERSQRFMKSLVKFFNSEAKAKKIYAAYRIDGKVV